VWNVGVNRRRTHVVEGNLGAGTYRKRRQSRAKRIWRPYTIPLREIATIRTRFSPQPTNDRFENYSSYCLAWFKVVLPSANLGQISGNKNTLYSGENIILGRDSPPLEAIVHNGNISGFTSAIFMFPGSQIAIVVLSSGATDGDAADLCAQLLTQRVFALKPEVDILALARTESAQRKTWYESHMLAP
jgi:hypothetical protein